MTKLSFRKSLFPIFFISLFSSFTSINLEYVKVLSGKVMIKLPDNFKLMDKQMIASKYSRNNIKPTEVYTNDAANVNVTFNLTSENLSKKDIPVYAKTSVRQIAALRDVNIAKNDIEVINSNEIAIIEFYSNAIDGKIYNLMFITSVDGKAMLGSFNCTAKELIKWQSAAYEMINSIKIAKRK